MSTAEEYAWTEGFSCKLAPEVVQRECRHIEKVYGELTPETFLKEAAPAGAILHPLIDWDDDTAAHSWRVQQARRVISSLRILYPPAPERMPAFVSVVKKTDGEAHRVYVSIAPVIKQGDSRIDWLRSELDRLVRLLARTERFAEFQPLREAASLVEQNLVGEMALATAAD